MFGVSNLLLVSSIGLASLGYFVFRLVQVRRSFKDLPKPPHSFLFGHLKLFGEATAAFPPNVHPQLYYTYLVQKYSLPEVFYIDLWPIGPSQVILAGPEAAMQILTVKPYPMHDEVGNFLEPMLGKGVIAAVNGPTWKTLHHILGPAFTPAFVKSMVASIADHVLVFHDRLRALADKGDAFSMEEETAKAVFDIIGTLVFGVSLDAQQGGSPLLSDMRAILDLSSVLRMSYNPITKAAAWLKRRSAQRACDSSLTASIQERYQTMKDEKQPPTRRNARSIMDRVILGQIQDGKTAGLDEEFLGIAVNNLKGLLVGGHGTTTDTFTFITLLLGLHPEVMTELRKEHDRIFHPDLATTVSMLRESPAKTNELEYTNAVIKETLRLFPIGFTIRKAPDDTASLEYNGQTYPTRDMMVVTCQHIVHYDSSLWPEPARFLPDRWLESYEPKPHRFAWYPFGRGPRSCMGQELAMDEMRIMLLLTARWFDFETVVQRKSDVPRVSYTDLDTVIGDAAFQELKLSAGPRTDMRTKVRLSGRA